MRPDLELPDTCDKRRRDHSMGALFIHLHRLTVPCVSAQGFGGCMHCCLWRPLRCAATGIKALHWPLHLTLVPAALLPTGAPVLVASAPLTPTAASRWTA